MNEKEKQRMRDSFKERFASKSHTTVGYSMVRGWLEDILSAQPEESEYISNQEELEEAMADYALKFPKVANQVARQVINNYVLWEIDLDKYTDEFRQVISDIFDYLDQGGE